MSSDDHDNLKKRGFGGSVGFGKSPALLVIDLIVGFTDPGSPLGSNATEEIARTNRLIDAARAADIPILFSTIRYELLAEAGVWSTKIEGLETLANGGGGTELDERLHRRGEDRLIVKKFASCFFGTSLASDLVAWGIDTLILAGCTTSGCVRATAVDGCQHGLRVLVARDAVVDRLPASHEQSLIDIEMKYGDVLMTEEIIKNISRRSAP